MKRYIPVDEKDGQQGSTTPEYHHARRVVLLVATALVVCGVVLVPPMVSWSQAQQRDAVYAQLEEAIIPCEDFGADYTVQWENRREADYPWKDFPLQRTVTSVATSPSGPAVWQTITRFESASEATSVWLHWPLAAPQRMLLELPVDLAGPTQYRAAWDEALGHLDILCQQGCYVVQLSLHYPPVPDPGYPDETEYEQGSVPRGLPELTFAGTLLEQMLDRVPLEP
ncbi:MAG: hypothetical protein CL878_02790 [Dehalococcoidia bacterium]|nr:hypothetical protein [Dehalococcoidia bacterium]